MDVAKAVLAHDDADPQVNEQAGEPAAGGDPHGRHGDQQDEGADEQELVEVVNSQRRFPSLARRGARGRVNTRSEAAAYRIQVLRYLT
ncbi:hypothetical protein Shyhy01_44280 [Streptomyces hygroscopicus subsp. hygroscopicus]|nr:hypothetical protein Shyhy01_44280 [Streptomyces hygroscopicus subsp. hygroscopicus]